MTHNQVVAGSSHLNSARGDFGIQNYEDAKKVYEAFLINDKND